MAYGALIPFFLLLENKSYKESFRWGYLSGFVANLGSLYWIGWVTLPGAIGAILALPLYTAFFALLYILFRRKWGTYHLIAVPFIWTGIEYLKSLSEIGFPWLSLGYTQTYYLPLIQFASITSVYGVSFWIVTINVVLFVLWQQWQIPKWRYRLIAIVVFIWLLPLIHGSYVLTTSVLPQERIKVALVQGNIDPFLKWERENRRKHYEFYKQLSRQAVHEHHPDLLIWPETATTFFLQYEYEYLADLKNFLDSLGVALMTGSQDYEYQENENLRYFNAAFLILPESASLQRYTKLHLVPFGERVPFEDFFPQFKQFLDHFEMGQGDFSPGKDQVVFSFSPSPGDSDGRKRSVGASIRKQPVQFAVPICYESIFPELIRGFVQKGSDFLAVITNDAWFGTTSGPFQHAQIAVFRAIENRIAIARCANTGISMFIDPYGRTRQKTKLNQPDVIADQVGLRNQETFYSTFGNVFTISVSVLGIIFILIALLMRKKAEAQLFS